MAYGILIVSIMVAIFASTKAPKWRWVLPLIPASMLVIGLALVSFIPMPPRMDATYCALFSTDTNDCTHYAVRFKYNWLPILETYYAQ